MKELGFGKKAISFALSGVMVAAFAPALVAPGAASAVTNYEESRAYAISVIEGITDRGEEKLTLADANLLVKHVENYNLIETDDLDEDMLAMYRTAHVAIKEIPAQKTLVNSVKVSIKKVTPGMKKAKVKITVTNPNKVTDLEYRFGYKAANASKWTYVTTDEKTYTFKNVPAKDVKFRARVQKKVYGETLKSAWSSKVTKNIYKKYTKGTYKVTASNLNLRKKATTNSKILTTLSKGKKIKATSFKTVSGRVWGKVKANGKTGYVEMRYTKEA